MYVYGGYVHAYGKLTTEVWYYDFILSRWTKVGPRKSNFDEDYNEDPADAITFPSALAPERFGTVGVSSSTAGLYILGGAGGADMSTELDDIWKFDHANKEWKLLERNAGIGSYDSAGAEVDSHVVLFGGLRAGQFSNAMYYYFMN